MKLVELQTQPDIEGRAHDRRLQSESAADVKSALHAIGISDEHGWLAAAVIYGAGGILATTLGLLNLVPVLVLYCGLIALVAAAISAYGIKHWRNGPPQEHLRTLFGLLLIFGAAGFVGPVMTAMMMLPMLSFLTPCYLYGPRFATPYAVGITVGTSVVMFFVVDPQTPARGIFAVGAVVMLIASMMVSEHHTRVLAGRNRRLAYTDPLTGIANTRRLREDISAATDHLRETGREFALFAIDLDDFKAVNDDFDHGTGDRVLQAVARELTAEVDPSCDLVARRGGDEFSVLVPRAGERGVWLEDLAVRLRGAITRARMEVCPSITPTGGVAYVVATIDDDMPSILTRADDQLHDVKEARRAIHGGRRTAPASEGRAKHHRIDDSDPDETKARSAILADLVEALNPFTSRFPGWGVTSLALMVIGLVTGTVAALGLLQPLSPSTGLLINGVICLLAIASRLAGLRDVSPRFLHVVYPLAIALVTLEVQLAGVAGEAMIDLYLVLMLYGYYVFSPRAATFYAATCALLFSGFAIGAGYVDGGVRSAVSLTVMLVVVGLVVQVRGITVQFARTHRELSELDGLTGLANLRALRSRLGTAIKAAESGGQVPAIVSIDLDQFKPVNDHYNHATGDAMLVAVARAISESVRAEDVVARRGGDEFVVLGGFDSPESFDAMVTRLNHVISHARRRICPDLVSTSSIGWALWEPGDDVDAMLGKSNLTLHSEKLASRSRADARSTG